MAKLKRKKGSQLSLKVFKDDRIPKLMGIICLLAAFYLLIAFTSYLFTWKVDQDKVLRFSWELLTHSEFEMANWLGRLGAIVSNGFFYWFFGFSSFIVVYVLGIIGVQKIKGRGFSTYWNLIRTPLIIMLFLSIFFGFVFRSYEFPWGGSVGKNISDWIVGFVGTAGMIALLIAMLAGVLTWVYNPNFNELTWDNLFKDTKNHISDWLNGRLSKRDARKLAIQKAAKAKEAKAAALALEKAEAAKKALPVETSTGTLRPSHAFKKPIASDELEISIPNPAVELDGEPIKTGEQLSIELDKTGESINDGESTLEIAVPAGATPTSPIAIETENTSHSEPYDPTLDLSSYVHPVMPLLLDYSDQKVEIDRVELEANKDQIIETLLNYKIEITKIKATIGPTVTLYEIIPAPGVRISKIKNLEDDIALSLAALGIRIIAPIPGKGTIGIEVPNRKPQMVSLKEVLSHDKFKNAKMDLPIALGKTIANEVFVADLAKMPHLLIAGATGQGKSVGINTIIMSLLYKKHPSQVKLVLIDPKKVELFPYSKLENHFLAYLPGLDEPIVTDTTKAVHTLNSLTIEMDQRYDLLKKAHARNIREYNNKFVARRLNPEKGHRFMPFIVLVIDEFADLIMTAGKEVELPIARLAQLSRAVGIHLIIATQRPSVNIITGVIKANFPARLAFKVTAKVDSRTIIDAGGADQLIGRGDMLLSFGSDLLRLQCAFVDTPEVEDVINHIANQQGYPVPFFLPEFHGDDEVHAKSGLKLSELDENFEDAARLVVSNQHGSTSMLQRRLKLGYNRAGRIMDQMEALGIVGASEGSKAREVLIFNEVELERYLEDIRNRK